MDKIYVGTSDYHSNERADVLASLWCNNVQSIRFNVYGHEWVYAFIYGCECKCLCRWAGFCVCDVRVC